MHENPNIDKKEEVMTYIYALESDEFTKTAAAKKDRINQVEELVECKVCRKQAGTCISCEDLSVYKE